MRLCKRVHGSVSVCACGCSCVPITCHLHSMSVLVNFLAIVSPSPG